MTLWNSLILSPCLFGWLYLCPACNYIYTVSLPSFCHSDLKSRPQIILPLHLFSDWVIQHVWRSETLRRSLPQWFDGDVSQCLVFLCYCMCDNLLPVAKCVNVSTLSLPYNNYLSSYHKKTPYTSLPNSKLFSHVLTLLLPSNLLTYFTFGVKLTPAI